MCGAEPKFQCSSANIDYFQGLVDGRDLIDDFEWTGVGAAAGEEDLDDEVVGLGDQML
jgi:hypothetical protein